MLFLVVGAVQAQTKESEKLKAKQRELQKKINYTKKLLGNTKNNQRLTLAELGIINQQIAHRNELISTFDRQIDNLNRLISDNESVILALEEDLKRLKDQYAQMIVSAYKNRNKYNSMMFVFSSDNFHEAYMRMKYMQRIVDYRKKQVELIQITKESLGKKQTKLKDQIEEKEKILRDQNEQRKNFEQDKSLQQEALAKLRNEESKLKTQLQDQEDKKRRLAAAIRKAIEREIAEEAKKNDNKIGLTPEAKLAARNFEANKGKLPWPVIRGEITGRFGKSAHPVVKGIQINNNGIDITTDQGADVRAVFKGTVSSVLVIPGAGKAVMVSHGNYRTVYSNLKKVYVKKGDQLDTKQFVGALLPHESGKNSICHLEVWKITGTKSSPQNPIYWIYR